MITKQEHTGFIRIEEYSLAAWLAEVESVIKAGYTFDFNSNETHPQAFGSMYTVMMVPFEPQGNQLWVESEEKVVPIPTPSTPSDVTVDEVTPVQTKRKNAKN